MLASIEHRQSTRRYKDRPVSLEDINGVLEAACAAPSRRNNQPWRFLVVTDAAKRAAIAEVSHNQRWMLGAPVHIGLIAEMRARLEGWDDPPLDEESGLPELKQIIRDVSIAASFLMLEADARGLGTCWIGWHSQSDIRRVLELPGHTYVPGVITLGWPDDPPRPRLRHSPEKLIHWERYSPDRV
jgi:nitroreductase